MQLIKLWANPQNWGRLFLGTYHISKQQQILDNRDADDKGWKAQAKPGLLKSASKCCWQIVTDALWEECRQGNFCRDTGDTLTSRGFQWILRPCFPIRKCASSRKTRGLHVSKKHIHSCKIAPLLRWTSHRAGVVLDGNRGIFWKYRCFQLFSLRQHNAAELPNQL